MFPPVHSIFVGYFSRYIASGRCIKITEGGRKVGRLGQRIGELTTEFQEVYVLGVLGGKRKSRFRLCRFPVLTRNEVGQRLNRQPLFGWFNFTWLRVRLSTFMGCTLRNDTGILSHNKTVLSMGLTFRAELSCCSASTSPGVMYKLFWLTFGGVALIE